jgi:dual oxidase maturation factor 1
VSITSLFSNFQWEQDYHTLADAKTNALQRGLPDPILTLAEYFGSEGYGFRWGPMYTLAGDRAKVALEFALAVLILSTVLVAVIPFYGLAIFPLVGELLCTLNLLSLILVSLRLVTFP